MCRIERALERTSDTKAVLIEKGAIRKCGAFFKKSFASRKAMIIADTNTWEAAGKRVCGILQESGIETCKPYIFESKGLYADWKWIEPLKKAVGEVDAVPIAIGSGVINDLTKYVSHLVGRKYLCIGTAASMDGFTSFGASITQDGNKINFSCPAPYAVLLDPEITASAPPEYNASGYADLIAKIPAGADWIIADAVGAESIMQEAFDMVQGGLRSITDIPSGIRNGDTDAASLLCEGLVMSGFAMQAMHDSRPASGTEHQFAHFWDMENLSYPDGRHVSHGFKVGIGTLVSTAAIEFLLEKDIPSIDCRAIAAKWESRKEQEDKIRKLFAGMPAHLERALKESEKKYSDRQEVLSQLEAIKSDWKNLRKKIQAQIIPFDKVRECLRLSGAASECEMIGVSCRKLRDTLIRIPFMRSRFTAIDAIYRLGYMDELEEKLFGKGGKWEI